MKSAWGLFCDPKGKAHTMPFSTPHQMDLPVSPLGAIPGLCHLPSLALALPGNVEVARPWCCQELLPPSDSEEDCKPMGKAVP